jgi:hypothetical protein
VGGQLSVGGWGTAGSRHCGLPQILKTTPIYRPLLVPFFNGYLGGTTHVTKSDSIQKTDYSNASLTSRASLREAHKEFTRD